MILHNLSAKPAKLDLDPGASCQGEATALPGDPLAAASAGPFRDTASAG